MKKKNKCDYNVYKSVADIVSELLKDGKAVYLDDVLAYHVDMLCKKYGDISLCESAPYIKPDQAKPGDVFTKDDLPF